MTEKRFEPDCNDCHTNQYDYSLLNSRYEADVERNEIIKWNKDADNAQFRGLERIADELNFKQMQLEKCRIGYEKLVKENEQVKDALNQRTIQCDKFYQENEQLKQRVKQLEDNIITKLKIIRGDVE